MDEPLSPPTISHIGKHVVRIEDGILQVLFGGDVSVDEVQRIQACMHEAEDRFGPLMALIDLNRVAGFDAGARAQFARPQRAYPFYAVAYHGGSFPMRMLVLTALRAGKLIAPNSFTSNAEIFETETEARRFLETARSNRSQAG